MKKIVAMFLVLLLALSFVACNNSSDPSKGEDESKLVYFVGLQSGGPAWVKAQESFYEACEELGWEGHYVAPTTMNDAGQMVTLCETAITQGADVIITVIFSEEAFADVCKRAREAGCIVISINSAASPDLIDFWFGTDQTTMGKAQAQAIIDNMDPDEEFSVVYMTMTLTSEMSNVAYEAMKAELEQYPNITVLEPQAPGNDAIKAADMLGALLVADPSIKAVISGTGQIALGIGNYVAENGLEDQLITVGIDQSADTLNYVKIGALDCTLTQGWYIMGHDTVIAAYEMMNGKEIPFANDSGVTTLYANDIDAFAEEWGIDLGA